MSVQWALPAGCLARHTRGAYEAELGWCIHMQCVCYLGRSVRISSGSDPIKTKACRRLLVLSLTYIHTHHICRPMALPLLPRELHPLRQGTQRSMSKSTHLTRPFTNNDYYNQNNNNTQYRPRSSCCSPASTAGSARSTASFAGRSTMRPPTSTCF